MSNHFIERITRRAAEARKTIILPEAEDSRVICAAARIIQEHYAAVVLLGQADAIHRSAKELGVDVSEAIIVDHLADTERDKYVQTLCERRKHKKMTCDQAADLLRQPVYYAGMMVADGRADGMVAGSICPTSDTIRSAIYSVGCAAGCKTISSCSIMKTIVPEVGVDGLLVFADTAVVPEPTVEQLADIAIAAADACQALLEAEPRVAMLSFSTKGSAHSPAVQKVLDATALVRSRRPELKVDGELQLDAAIIPEVVPHKTSENQVAGTANTLIFPNLSAGNIGYKLVERLGRAKALGPLLLGLARPVNDLSRGCGQDEIILTTAITSLQAS